MVNHTLIVGPVRTEPLGVELDAVCAGRCGGGRPVRKGQYFPAVRLIVARCEVNYTGRAAAFLPAAVRLVMVNGDGTVMIWDDSGSYKVKPLNCVR